jgi:toxin secretion/phage lysis holin
MVEKYFVHLLENSNIKLLLIFIIFDIVFGILRAIKERKLNSTIGIDGMIRKTGMILSDCFLFLIDRIINLNFVGFVPEEILSFLNLKFVGIGDLFNIIFIIFEALSVLKNMYKCKLPIPKKLEKAIEKLLTEFTEEVKKEGE